MESRYQSPSTFGSKTSFSCPCQTVPGTLGSSHASKTSLGGAGIVRSTVTSPALSFARLLLRQLSFLSEMTLEPIEALVPEALVRVHPNGHLAQGFAAKRDDDLPTLPSTLDEPGSLKQLQVFRHRVQSRVERLCDIRESGRSLRQLPNDRSPGRVRNGAEDVTQVIHGDITPYGVMKRKPPRANRPGRCCTGRLPRAGAAMASPRPRMSAPWP